MVGTIGGGATVGEATGSGAGADSTTGGGATTTGAASVSCAKAAGVPQSIAVAIAKCAVVNFRFPRFMGPSFLT